MSDFWTAFDKHEKQTLATADGAALKAAGFEFSHTGGGCTAFQREIVGYQGFEGWEVWVTDSGGTDAIRSYDVPDCYVIGVHGPDGEHCALESYRQVQTAAEAVVAADAIVADLVAGKLTLE